MFIFTFLVLISLLSLYMKKCPHILSAPFFGRIQGRSTCLPKKKLPRLRAIEKKKKIYRLPFLDWIDQELWALYCYCPPISYAFTFVYSLYTCITRSLLLAWVERLSSNNKRFKRFILQEFIFTLNRYRGKRETWMDMWTPTSQQKMRELLERIEIFCS